MPNDWRKAYLKQAYSDFCVVRFFLTEVAATQIARCHLIHYLQMALEKLAKGYRIPRDGSDIPHTHKGACHLIQLLIPTNLLNQPIHNALGMSDHQRRAYLRAILPTITIIERMAPALAKDGQNVEYPWQVPNSDNIIPPVECAFDLPELTETKIRKVVDFLETIFHSLQKYGEL